MDPKTADCTRRLLPRLLRTTFAVVAIGLSLPATAATAQGKVLALRAPEVQNTQEPYAGPAVVGPTMTLVTGKSTLLRLETPIDRVSVGNPAIADVTIISPRELYILGKS